VPPQTVPSVRLPVSLRALRARRNISSEALRVNVRSMIRPGSIPCDTSQATRDARVLVLPVAGINPDTITEWRKDPEFSGAIKRATAQRLLLRLERIEAGEQGWQGTAWALERIYPHRFARPEVMNQIAVLQGGKVPER
jgi:hypothetical protein